VPKGSETSHCTGRDKVGREDDEPGERIDECRRMRSRPLCITPRAGSARWTYRSGPDLNPHQGSGKRWKNMRLLLAHKEVFTYVLGLTRPQARSAECPNSRFRAIDIVFINRAIQSRLIQAGQLRVLFNEAFG
jgi:hypothetical protein